MDKSVIADRKPKMTPIEAGKGYAWCACGRSEKQPFCDGSHAGTTFKPVIFKGEKDGDAALCMCKMSSNKPFCDGSHARLDADGNLPPEAGLE